MTRGCPDCFGRVKPGDERGEPFVAWIARCMGHQMTEPEAAGLGRRAAGIALDWLLAIGISRVVFGQFPYGSPESSLGILTIFALEVVLLTWLTTASFGQRVVGLQVIRLGGGRLPLWRVVVRTLLICLVIPAVIIDSDGRGLQDRAVGSIVIRRPRTRS